MLYSAYTLLSVYSSNLTWAIRAAKKKAPNLDSGWPTL